MRAVEKQVLLQTLDHLWREHLATLDHLRSVIGFRGYAQRDPLNEYKTEGFELFQTLLANLRRAVTGQLAHVEIQQRPPEPPPAPVARGAPHRPDDRRGRDGAAAAAGSPRAAGRSARPKRDAKQSLDLGQGRPQRALPLRLRQEIQAVPRHGDRLTLGARDRHIRPRPVLTAR